MDAKRTFDILDGLKLIDNKPDILAVKRDGLWVKFSVSEYVEQARHFAIGLLSLGFQKGDKIATVSNNRPEWNFVDMGMAMVGVAHVPIYPTIGDDEYRYILQCRLVKESSERLYFIGVLEKIVLLNVCNLLYDDYLVRVYRG